MAAQMSRALAPPQPLLQLPGGLVGEGDGDDGPGGGPVHGAQPLSPLPVLRGRIPGEALQEGQILVRGPLRHLPGVAAPAEGQQVVHPVNQHGGLAAARAGQQQKGPLRGQHGLLLGGVHMLVPLGDHRPAGGDIAIAPILFHSACLSFMKYVNRSPHSNINPPPGQPSRPCREEKEGADAAAFGAVLARRRAEKRPSPWWKLIFLKKILDLPPAGKGIIRAHEKKEASPC